MLVIIFNVNMSRASGIWLKERVCCLLSLVVAMLRAVSVFDDSCSQYGEVADECGDVYFWYGKALLEVARQEGGILGDAVPGGMHCIGRCKHNTRKNHGIDLD